MLGWDGDDGGRASETAVGVRIPGVALAVVFSSCAPSPMSGSRPASGPFGLCVILWPLPEVSSEINGSCDCFSCSSTSISRSLLSSCSSSVFWKVMDCRLQSGSVFVWGEVLRGGSLPRDLSGQEVQSIAHQEGVVERSRECHGDFSRPLSVGMPGPETKYLRRETFVGFPAWVWICMCHCDSI